MSAISSDSITLTQLTLPDSRRRRSSSVVRTYSAPGTSSGLHSPGESPFSSDDENARPRLSRGRELDRDLEHSLHEAVSSITLTRSLSPEPSAVDEATSSQGLHDITGARFQTALPSGPNETRHRHTKSEGQSDNDDDDDQTIVLRPHKMIRKKSGELVRSSLKVSGGKSRRAASVPSTPAHSKNVHFDRQLEQVRHFLYTEKPTAVSANTSPSQEYYHNTEFPFVVPKKDDFELTIELPNFVPEAQQVENNDNVIKVETVYLSTDKRSLIGRVAVKNLDFHKSVVVRYTLDYWRTTSECAAEYTQDVRRKHRGDSFDRFLFHIKIDDFSGVTDKTMFFCVRYNTAGQEFWDSNGGMNFRVEFHKVSAHERRSSDPPAFITPFSGSRNHDLDDDDTRVRLPKTLSSPNSLIYDNIYDDHPSNVFDEPDHERPIMIKQQKKKAGQSTDVLSIRYNFGTSLTAAKAQSASPNKAAEAASEKPLVRHVEDIRDFNPYFELKPRLSFQAGLESGTMSPNFPPALDSSENNTPISSGNVSPVPGIPAKPSLLSSTSHGSSYQELINNYCFFGTKPTRPQVVGNLSKSALTVPSLTNHDAKSPEASESNTPRPPSSPMLCSRASPDFNEHHSSGTSTPVIRT